MENTKLSKRFLQKQKTMSLLIEAAIPIFEEKGFEGANITEITSAAQVGLGSLNNNFENMEGLGAYVLYVLLMHAVAPLKDRLSFDSEPILYALTKVSVHSIFLTEKWNYRLFFLEALKRDFIMNYIMKDPDSITLKLIHSYKPDARPDRVILYSEFMPYMLGRTLFLKKEEGFFETIPYEDIPLMVVQEALRHFVPEREIRKMYPEARRLAMGICDTVPHRPSMELIERSIQELS